MNVYSEIDIVSEIKNRNAPIVRKHQSALDEIRRIREQIDHLYAELDFAESVKKMTSVDYSPMGGFSFDYERISAMGSIFKSSGFKSNEIKNMVSLVRAIAFNDDNGDFKDFVCIGFDSDPNTYESFPRTHFRLMFTNWKFVFSLYVPLIVSRSHINFCKYEKEYDLHDYGMYNPGNQEYKYDRIGTFYATWKCNECTITSTNSELSIDFNRKEILEMVMENKDLENIKWN